MGAILNRAESPVRDTISVTMPVNPGFSLVRDGIGGLVFHISSLTGLGTTCLAYSYRYFVPDGTFDTN